MGNMARLFCVLLAALTAGFAGADTPAAVSSGAAEVAASTVVEALANPAKVHADAAAAQAVASTHTAVADMITKQQAAAAANAKSSAATSAGQKYEMGPNGKLVKADPAAPTHVKTTVQRNMAVMFRTDPASCESCDLHEAQFTKWARTTELLKAELRGSDLRDANFANCDLREADFRGANLEGADFRGAHLGGARLEGANLKNVRLAGSDFQKTCMEYFFPDKNFVPKHHCGQYIEPVTKPGLRPGIDALETQVAAGLVTAE